MICENIRNGGVAIGIFGDFFDFDGDGKASLFEELLGLELLGFFDTEEDDFDDEEPEGKDDL